MPLQHTLGAELSTTGVPEQGIKKIFLNLGDGRQGLLGKPDPSRQPWRT